MNPSKKVLVAYDGSSGAKGVLVDLKFAGLPSKTQVLVLSVADVVMPPSGKRGQSILKPVPKAVQKGWAHVSQMLNRSERLAAQAARQIKSHFPKWRVASQALADFPAWGIIKTAQKWKADLIAIGSHRVSGARRLILGSVSEKVVSEASCSVRVVHKIPKNKSSLKIMVGVDGSAYADYALQEVAARSWKRGSAICLMSVIDSGVKWAALSKSVNRHSKKLKAKGFSVTPLVKAGNPKKVLIDEANRWGADSIFVGVRGLSLMQKILIGSVASSVAARARSSVEVVRRL
ncbi:MAG: universal stress protein [Candidatus Omnitrophica bacterium]|nr:universal stress protein [Candidatus Omnitrophota bacterium]